MRAILRRTGASASSNEVSTQSSISQFGIELNPETLEARVNQVLIELTGAEFRVLHMLMSNAGKPLSKEIITEEVLRRKLTAYDRSIDVHISRVRQKLNSTPGHNAQIKTVRGIGYQISENSEA